jgi:hypothetical protein
MGGAVRAEQGPRRACAALSAGGRAGGPRAWEERGEDRFQENPKRRKRGFAPSVGLQRTERTRIRSGYSLPGWLHPPQLPDQTPQKWVGSVRVGHILPTKHTVIRQVYKAQSLRGSLFVLFIPWLFEPSLYLYSNWNLSRPPKYSRMVTLLRISLFYHFKIPYSI